MDYEEAYFRDVLPRIGRYVQKNNQIDFETDDIYRDLEGYSQSELENVLADMAERDEVKHLEQKGQNKWQFKAFQEETWKNVENQLEHEHEGRPSIESPGLNEEITEITAQEYGKLRKNIGEVYEGLKEIKSEKTSHFKTGELKEKIYEVRGPEIGTVLSGLNAAGLIDKHGRRGYSSESIEEDEIEKFRELLEKIETLEAFKQFIEQEGIE